MAARLACGHWPPEAADTGHGAQRGSHDGTALTVRCRLATSGPRAGRTSTRTNVVSLPSPEVSGQSEAEAPRTGNRLHSRSSRHRLTLERTAERIALGESMAQSQVTPVSSRSVRGERNSQPRRAAVATAAAAGPATHAQTEAACARRSFASAKEAARSSVDTQRSHHAVAHCAMGMSCAACAGSTDCPVVSRRWNTMSGLRPEPGGDAAAATQDRVSCSHVLLTPHTSCP